MAHEFYFTKREEDIWRIMENLKEVGIAPYECIGFPKHDEGNNFRGTAMYDIRDTFVSIRFEENEEIRKEMGNVTLVGNPKNIRPIKSFLEEKTGIKLLKPNYLN